MDEIHRIGLIYTTVASVAESDTLAFKAIEYKLAACVNILPSIRSVYKWDDQVETYDELGMIFKTSVEKLNPLKEWLIANHPYKVPAIIELPVNSSFAFQNYIQSSVH
jgi:periplasmic divalent cation tolerance protein